jgi:hypothetical protein
LSVRKDLNEVEGFISRLLSIGKEFEAMDDRWSHMKNREDFDTIYQIKDYQKKSDIEEIYAIGRDMAGFMAEALYLINVDFIQYPTLTSIIKRIEGCWVYEDFSEYIEKAVRAHDELELNVWAFRQMIQMLKQQISLLDSVKATFNLLKNSELFKLENGIPMKKHSDGINITASNSNVSVNSAGSTQSLNITNNVFSELRDAIKNSEIENKSELLESVVKLEDSQRRVISQKAIKNLSQWHQTIWE